MSEIGFSIEGDAEIIEATRNLVTQTGGEMDEPTPTSGGGPLHSPLHGTLLTHLTEAYYLFKTAGAAADFLNKLQRLVAGMKKPAILVTPDGKRQEIAKLGTLTAASVSAFGKLPQ